MAQVLVEAPDIPLITLYRGEYEELRRTVAPFNTKFFIYLSYPAQIRPGFACHPVAGTIEKDPQEDTESWQGHF
jgi:hypothetical protein